MTYIQVKRNINSYDISTLFYTIATYRQIFISLPITPTYGHAHGPS